MYLWMSIDRKTTWRGREVRRSLAGGASPTMQNYQHTFITWYSAIVRPGAWVLKLVYFILSLFIVCVIPSIIPFAARNSDLYPMSVGIRVALVIVILIALYIKTSVARVFGCFWESVQPLNLAFLPQVSLFNQIEKNFDVERSLF